MPHSLYIFPSNTTN